MTIADFLVALAALPEDATDAQCQALAEQAAAAGLDWDEVVSLLPAIFEEQ